MDFTVLIENPVIHKKTLKYTGLFIIQLKKFRGGKIDYKDWDQREIRPNW